MIAPVPLNGGELVTAAKPPLLLSGIDPVAAIKPTSSDRGETQRLLAQLAPGQILSARVGARLADGSHKVDVAGAQMRMALPAGISAGDTLALTFLTRAPRPTFMLQQGQTQAANAPVLSAAGRLVATLLPQPGEPAVVARAPSAPPLLASLPATGAGLSAALQQTLTQSGLFYEAHQAEWVAGKHDLAQLRAEPQARLALSAAQSPALATEDAAAATKPAAADATSAAAAPRTEQLMRPEGSTLVQQQLAALESGKILLHLEVWPKQWMQWEVEEQAQQAAHEADADAPASWHTRLRLELPQLGALEATLTLGSNGVQIKLNTARSASASLMQDHRNALQTALAAAGVPPAGIAIARHEPP